MREIARWSIRHSIESHTTGVLGICLVRLRAKRPTKRADDTPYKERERGTDDHELSLRGAGPTLPSSRSQGEMARYEATGPKNAEK